MNSHNQAHLENMMQASLRDIERFDHLHFEQTCLSDRVACMKSELKRTRRRLAEREYYIEAFQSQLWRTIHDSPVRLWPKLFAKLYKDHTKGKLENCAFYDIRERRSSQGGSSSE